MASRICGPHAPRPEVARQHMGSRPLPLRLVLDTNVWLDWLVFNDVAIAPIKSAVDSGQAQIFIDAACTEELTRVLGYRLQRSYLNTDRRAGCLAELSRVADLFATPPVRGSSLPACHDADDQKFLELARDCRADYLVTKDRALLVLATRKFNTIPFDVMTPAQMRVALCAPA